MTHKVAHPSTYIDKTSLEIIRNSAAEAEQLDDLHPDQLAIIYDHKWFRMFVPAAYGGLGWSLPEVLRAEESLSWADGSVGWVVTLCSGAGWFSGFLQPSLLKELLSGDQACFAGSGAATGIANVTSNGFEISGHWKYASGSLHATIFTANCFIHNGGVPEVNPDGSPSVAAFWFRRQEVTLHPHWKSLGMIATGSHSFSVRELAVPDNRRFAIDKQFALLDDAVYQYPFMQLAETTLSVNVSGMAVSFLDLCEPLFLARMKKAGGSFTGPDLRALLASARESLETLRAEFYAAVERSWERCVRGEALPQGVLNQVTRTSYALAHGALKAVDELYPYCGLTAADPRTEINRVWRNIHTASQHALFRMM